MIWFEKFLKFVGNGLELVWKFLVISAILTSNKSSWNNWVLLKRNDSSSEKD